MRVASLIAAAAFCLACTGASAQAPGPDKVVYHLSAGLEQASARS
jgi:hypothetical protein